MCRRKSRSPHPWRYRRRSPSARWYGWERFVRRIRSTPRFLQIAPGRSGLILPLVVDQLAVALVFLDGAADTLKWGDVVEVLVRHGSARLESVTSQRTVEVLTASS